MSRIVMNQGQEGREAGREAGREGHLILTMALMILVGVGVGGRRWGWVDAIHVLLQPVSNFFLFYLQRSTRE